MTRGALVGDASGALTTAVALLYAAQVRRSNASPDYRFSVAAAGHPVVGRLYASLQEGVRPGPPDEGALAKVSFAMDFPDSLGKKLLGGFRRGRTVGDAHELDLGVLPLVRHHESGVLAPAAGGWGAAVDVGLFVLVADASPGSAGDPGLDSGFDRLLTSFPTGVPPCVLLWVLAAPPSPDLPPASAEQARQALGSANLVRQLPRTAARLAAAKQSPPSFYAWLEPDLSGGPTRIVRRQLLEAGGIEPKYPYEEFLALFDTLAGLAG
ncbi:MAG TPA: hypothetical protein VGB42_11070 [Candidatus Thermoplasmatota archaeon]